MYRLYSSRVVCINYRETMQYAYVTDRPCSMYRLQTDHAVCIGYRPWSMHMLQTDHAVCIGYRQTMQYV